MHYQNDDGRWYEANDAPETDAPPRRKIVWDKDRFPSPEVRATTDAAGWILGEHLAAARKAQIEEIIDGHLPVASTRTPDGGSPAYRALLDEAWGLHLAKNAGYSPGADPWANFRQCEAFGVDALDGVITRMGDKWARLCALWRNPERDQVGESIEDTLKDLSAYALILVCLLQERAEP